MRILIDECIDERFRNSLSGHDCQTARYAGLAGLKNGDLLTAAETKKFDVFLTVDQGIEYQQNLAGRNIAIIIFRTKSSRLKDLLPHLSVSRTLNPFSLARSLESKARSSRTHRGSAQVTIGILVRNVAGCSFRLLRCRIIRKSK
jgi:hypothetical protein